MFLLVFYLQTYFAVLYSNLYGFLFKIILKLSLPKWRTFSNNKTDIKSQVKLCSDKKMGSTEYEFHIFGLLAHIFICLNFQLEFRTNGKIYHVLRGCALSWSL